MSWVYYKFTSRGKTFERELALGSTTRLAQLIPHRPMTAMNIIREELPPDAHYLVFACGAEGDCPEQLFMTRHNAYASRPSLPSPTSRETES